MLNITFKYTDAMSNWEWRTQHCVVSSVKSAREFMDLIMAMLNMRL